MKSNKNKLADFEGFHDTGAKRPQDFPIDRDPERTKHAADAVKNSTKDPGKSKMTGEGAPRFHKAPVWKPIIANPPVNPAVNPAVDPAVPAVPAVDPAVPAVNPTVAASRPRKK